MNIKKYINELGKQAYAASRKMAAASSDTKNAALHAIAKEIIKNKDANTLEERLVSVIEQKFSNIDKKIHK